MSIKKGKKTKLFERVEKWADSRTRRQGGKEVLKGH